MKKSLELFLMFFKLGLFTFGGGYAMLPQIRREVIENKKWLTEDEMIKVIAIAESTPGPLAINMATYVGYKQNKILGSVFSTLGVVLPSLIIIFLISLFFEEFVALTYVSYAFKGIKCAVAFLIIKAGLAMAKKLEKKAFTMIILFVTLALSISFELFNIDFSSIYLIIIGALLGALVYSRQKGKEIENNDLS